MSRCKSCDARIRWATTARGESIPLDAEPNPAGNVWLDVELGEHNERIETARIADLLTPPDATRFMPHHATCPQGKSWRRG